MELVKIDGMVLNPGLLDIQNISDDMESGNMFLAATDNSMEFRHITDSEFTLARNVLYDRAKQILRENNSADHVIYAVQEFKNGKCIKGRLCLISLSDYEYQSRIRHLNKNIACYTASREGRI